MRWNAVKNLLILASSTTLLVESLRCYVGHEGKDIIIKTAPEYKPNEWMCVYETLKPCDFQEPLKNGQRNFRMTKYVDRACFAAKERAICYCNNDLCNGDFKIFLEKWENSRVRNQTLYNCVKKHIESKKSLTGTSKVGRSTTII
ncbi:hypothetical protein Y032_0016g3012 [Ancylostoma ceylanicum]|uniref:Uncharacterized protein n=1 Tax=Ancylostoma ceylanicum TaxID=53326 RepID=A0A016V6J5_9BILA|nr:hypothetical protein Y032_0016g3012 [Ancylostoma ceylanicum]